MSPDGLVHHTVPRLHRDLKGQNIFLTSNNMVKLGAEVDDDGIGCNGFSCFVDVAFILNFNDDEATLYSASHKKVSKI